MGEIRGEFAEFLGHRSPIRLLLLGLPTGVGFRYGGRWGVGALFRSPSGGLGRRGAGPERLTARWRKASPGGKNGFRHRCAHRLFPPPARGRPATASGAGNAAAPPDTGVSPPYWPSAFPPSGGSALLRQKPTPAAAAASAAAARVPGFWFAPWRRSPKGGKTPAVPDAATIGWRFLSTEGGGHGKAFLKPPLRRRVRRWRR